MGKKNTSISDETVLKATGRSWDVWFELIDAQNGRKKTHKEIVAVIKASGDVDPWWQQMVTVEYEQAYGLRKIHEMPDGFQISKSKTIAGNPNALFDAWVDPKKRKTWLDDPNFTIRKSNPPNTIRITWVDGSSDVNVYFYPRKLKTQVSINHGKLFDEKQAGEMKAYWTQQLKNLTALIENSSL